MTTLAWMMLDSPSGGLDGHLAPKIKRQIFKNRPDWGTPDTSAASRANDKNDFFSRSNETLSGYDFDEDRKKKNKKKKKRASTPPREQINTPARDEDTERQNVPKRRRLSESDSDYEELYTSGCGSRGSPRTASKSEKPSKAPDAKGSNVKTTRMQKERPEMVIVELSDDENANGGVNPLHSSSPTPAPRSSSTSPMPSIEVSAGPIEHNNLRHGTRSPAKKSAANPRTSSTPIEILDEAPAPAPASAQRFGPLEPVPPAPPAPDPVLNILIHSRLPDTTPLIAQRKFSQRLREVRQAWCKRQGFTPAQTAVVFLAWRGRRIFDFTTFRSLGIQVSSLGDVSIKGQVLPPGEEGAQIEMEAVTPEIWEEMQREREGRGKLAANEQPGEGDGGEAAAPATTAAAAGGVQQTRIILRSRDYGEYKLAVKATTKFFRIADAYRRHSQIPGDKEVLLMFEGEKLEPSGEMKDSDVGELDYVDVYVK